MGQRIAAGSWSRKGSRAPRPVHSGTKRPASDQRSPGRLFDQTGCGRWGSDRACFGTTADAAPDVFAADQGSSGPQALRVAMGASLAVQLETKRAEAAGLQALLEAKLSEIHD